MRARVAIKMYFKSVLILSFITISSVFCKLRAGSRCETQNGAGICVNFYRCPTVIGDMQNRRFPGLCTTEGSTPIVCCDSCSMVHNISDAVFLPTGAMVWKTGSRSYDNCLDYSKYAAGRCRKTAGVYNQWDAARQCSRLVHYSTKSVVRGRNAWRKEFPHMALLGYGGTVNSAQWLCGGSLVSDRYILTAAHCSEHTRLGAVTYVALGILKRSDPPSLWQTYRVLSIINHPDYRPPSKYNDIALLQTDTQIQFSPGVFPACLQAMEADEERRYPVTATGWGATGYKTKVADTLQVARFEAFNNKECRDQYSIHRNLEEGFDSNTQMCFGDRRKPVDTCEGDSGGPLQIEHKSLCMYVVLGVTSYGRACGLAGQAGVYTRVSHYLDWIEDTVWP